MPRHARIDIPGLPCHICVRAVDGMPILANDTDRIRFLELLHEAMDDRGFLLHAFVLMTNHVHLLATPQAKGAMAAVMKHVSQRCAQFFNRYHDRRGPLLQDRYWSSVIEEELYFYRTMRYIELNPVRAGMVITPDEFAWSSHAHNTGRLVLPGITFHDQYLQLGPTPAQRAAEWGAFVAQGISHDELDHLRKRFTRNRPAGSTDFEKRLGFGDRIRGRAPEPVPEVTRRIGDGLRSPSPLLEVARLDEGDA